MRRLSAGLDGSGAIGVGHGAGLILTAGRVGMQMTRLGPGGLRAATHGGKDHLKCPGLGGILIQGSGSGGTGKMHRGSQWMIPLTGGHGMTSPGHGGGGMRSPGQIVRWSTRTGGTGRTTSGMPLSGSTIRTSGTVGLIMLRCTQLNGIQLALKGANSQENLPTCDLLAVTSVTQSFLMLLAVASCSSLTATLSDLGSTL